MASVPEKAADVVKAEDVADFFKAVSGIG